MACLLVAAAGLALPAAAPAVPPDGEVGPLPWRIGGPLGFTVDAAAFPDSAGMLEVYVRIPPRTLAGLRDDVDGSSRVRLTLRLRTRYGGRHHDASQEFAVAPEDTGGAFGKVLVMRFPAKPGGYRLEARLEDLLSRKRGIAYVGRNVPKQASVEGEVKVEPGAPGIELSDPEFLWTAGGAGAAFQRGGQAHLPNPERLYGVYAPAARVAFTARATDGAASGWRWRARVLDAAGAVVAERDSVAAPAATLAGEADLDLATVPAGAYTLELQVEREGGGALTRRATMEVAWQIGSWRRDPEELEDEVHFLFEPKEEDAFSRMGPGAREHAIQSFWLRRDPDPDTGENEARTAFLGRIEHANRTWTRAGSVKGMYSDMGRVYIRHGEPDETLRQVLPAGDQTLLQVLQSLDLTERRPTGEIDQKGYGGDIRPFEIWTYDMYARRPLTAPRDAVLNEKARRRMLFLFVDEQGYGDYRLRYSTE